MIKATVIKDTGIGIPQDHLSIIFDRFTQADSSTSRKNGGTGLGLAICKKILEDQGITLQVKSEVNKGSEFYFTQTYERVKMKEIPMKNIDELMKQPNALNGVEVLLVEDNDMNVLVAQRFLEKWGAAVTVAENGAEALQKLDTQKHRIVLMDMHMPVMDGYEATRLMRANGIKIPIIALTASVPSDIHKQLIQTGVDDIIVKPFKPEELLGTILRLIN